MSNRVCMRGGGEVGRGQGREEGMGVQSSTTQCKSLQYQTTQCKSIQYQTTYIVQIGTIPVQHRTLTVRWILPICNRPRGRQAQHQHHCTGDQCNQIECIQHKMHCNSMHHIAIVVLFSVTLAVEQSLFTQWKPSQGQRKKNTSVQSCISAVLYFWSCSYISAVLKCYSYSVASTLLQIDSVAFLQCCSVAGWQCCALTWMGFDWIEWRSRFCTLHTGALCTVPSALCIAHCSQQYAVHSVHTLVCSALCHTYNLDCTYLC